MGEEFIVNVQVEDQDPAADAIETFDLPVNPLSMILLHMFPLNETSTITNFLPGRDLTQALNSIRVLHLGKSIFDASGPDAWAALLHRWHRTVNQDNQVNTDNDRRSLTLPIMFGRFPGDPDWCIPATRAGELQLRVDYDVADTGYDDLRFNVSCLQLPRARPSHFLRTTTISQTFAATGRNDIALPVGHDILGLLLFGTTEFAGAAPAPSFGRMEILKDGVQTDYSSIDWEVARAIGIATGRPFPEWVAALVSVNVAASTETDSRLLEQMHQNFDEYAYLEFDWDRTARYALDTRGAARVVLRADAETADAVRVLPIEKVPISFFGM